jgi:hypothetical protein
MASKEAEKGWVMLRGLCTLRRRGQWATGTVEISQRCQSHATGQPIVAAALR